MLKRERKANRVRIEATLQEVDFFIRANGPKPKQVNRLAKIASNPRHPNRQAALDELGTVASKGRFVNAVMTGK